MGNSDLFYRILDKTISNINQNVSSIGTSAFYSCKGLISAVFPVCTTIEESAFYGCSALVSVSFLKCTIMRRAAFGYCTALRLASFPSCTEVGEYAFHYCSVLETVSFPECNIIGSGAFNRCMDLTSAMFPACTMIYPSAFAGCSALVSVSFPACMSIEFDAFQNCSHLRSALFPACITIGRAAFSICSTLRLVSFSACKTIGSNAFYYCSALLSAYFLASSLATLSNSNAFTYTPMQTSTYLGVFGSIYVPSSLVASYKAATNWTYYSARIVGYEPPMISFIIGASTYQAEEGMTWSEWVNSGYNVDGHFYIRHLSEVDDDLVYDDRTLRYVATASMYEPATNVIIENYTYALSRDPL